MIKYYHTICCLPIQTTNEHLPIESYILVPDAIVRVCFFIVQKESELQGPVVKLHVSRRIFGTMYMQLRWSGILMSVVRSKEPLQGENEILISQQCDSI